MKKLRYISKFCIRFIIGSTMMVLPASAQAKYISKNTTDISHGPSFNGNIIFSVPLGGADEINKNADKWIISHDCQNNYAWVYKPLVTNIDTAVVLVKRANIRNSASDRSRVINKVGVGEIYKVLARQRNWIRLGSYHEDTPLGWIRSDLVIGEQPIAMPQRKRWHN